jgi:hypothetical protein
MTLQEATNTTAFVDGATSSGITIIPNPGHNFDEIWVSVDGDEKTLQDALSIFNGLCGSPPTTPYLSAPSSLAYHFANEIEISPDTSLQDAIDSGDFCIILPIDGEWSEWSAWSACSVPCASGTQSRTRTCTNPPPSNGGADCVGPSSESRACNTQMCTGYGCGGCPFGSFSCGSGNICCSIIGSPEGAIHEKQGRFNYGSWSPWSYYFSPVCYSNFMCGGDYNCQWEIKA